VRQEQHQCVERTLNVAEEVVVDAHAQHFVGHGPGKQGGEPVWQRCHEKVAEHRDGQVAAQLTVRLCLDYVTFYNGFA